MICESFKFRFITISFTFVQDKNIPFHLLKHACANNFLAYIEMSFDLRIPEAESDQLFSIICVTLNYTK